MRPHFLSLPIALLLFGLTGCPSPAPDDDDSAPADDDDSTAGDDDDSTAGDDDDSTAGDDDDDSSAGDDDDSSGGGDNDNDGYDQAEDCDDGNSAINPAAAEVCDSGVDEDCNPASSCDGFCIVRFDFNQCDSLPTFGGGAPLINWDYDATGSSDITDASGTLDGMFTGSPTSVSGVVGNGLELDGSSWAYGATTAPLNEPAYTMMTWARVSPGSTGFDFIMSSGDGSVPYTGTALMLNGANMSSLFEAQNSGLELIVDGPAVCTDAWTHLAMTFDNGAVTLFQEGIPVASGVAGFTSIVNGTNPFGVGNDPNNSTRAYTGALDESLVYNSSLSGGDVTTAMASQLCGNWTPPAAAVDGDGDGYDDSVDCNDGDGAINPGASEICDSGVNEDCDPTTSCDGFCITSFDFGQCATLPAYAGSAAALEWNYDTAGASDVSDSAGTVDGSYVGVPTTVTGVMGDGLDFDGTSWVEGVSPAPLNASTFTMMTWVNTAGGSGLDFIMSSGDGSTPYTGTALMLNGNDISTLFEAGSSGLEVLFDAGPVCSSSWTHLAMTFDTGVIEVYADGVSIGSTTAGYSAIVHGTNPFAIANDPNNTTRYFTGSVDETLVFNTGLTSSEVNSVMEHQLCGIW